MKRLTLIMIALFCSTLCSAQQVLWLKYFTPANESNYYPTLLHRSDGGFLMAAPSTMSNDIGSGPGDAFLARTDRNGNTLWEQTISGYFYLRPFAINARGTGYGIVGEMQPAADSLRYFWFATLDSSGSVTSRKRVLDMPENVSAASVTSDNGFIVVMVPPYNQNDTAVFARLDSNGGVLWTRRFTNVAFFSPQVHETADGGFIVAGVGAMTGTYVMRISATGDSLWAHGYDKGGSIAVDIRQTEDGGFLVTSSQVVSFIYVPFVLKVDAGGMLQSTYSDPSWPDAQLTCISPTNDGNFMMVGYTFNDSRYPLIMMKVDQAGTPLWNSFARLGEATPHLYLPQGLQVLDDGSYVLAGSAWSDHDDLFLMKIGELPAGVEKRKQLPSEMDLSSGW